MVILIFTSSFAVAFILTKSYRFLDKYYSTVLYVSCSAALYQAVCRGHLLWLIQDWFFFTSKLSVLTQFAVLFPCTTVLFLRYFPHRKWTRLLYYLGFVGVYILMEWFLSLRNEIAYQYGWTFGWSVFIDFALFAMAWIHSRSWKIALPISACNIAFLMAWFDVPLTG